MLLLIVRLSMSLYIAGVLYVGKKKRWRVTRRPFFRFARQQAETGQSDATRQGGGRG